MASVRRRATPRATRWRALADQGIGTIDPLSGAAAPAAGLRRPGYKRGDFPLAEAIHEEVLSLPMGPTMSEADALTVCAAVRQALAQ